MLPLNLSDTAATSQDCLSLHCLSHQSRVGSAIFRMQVAEGCEVISSSVTHKCYNFHAFLCVCVYVCMPGFLYERQEKCLNSEWIVELYHPPATTTSTSG